MSEAASHDYDVLAPVSSGVKSLIVFGGTFDPPHRAHIELPEHVRQKIGADWILYVPAGRSPLRASNPIATDSERLQMLKLALNDASGAAVHRSVSPIELLGSDESDFAADPGSNLRPPSYTVEMLRKLRVLLPPETSMRLLIGADQALAFHRWRQPREIIRLAEPVVMLRAPNESAESLIGAMRANWSPDEVERWKGRIVTVPTMDVSATTIRDSLRDEGPDSPRLGEMLDPRVREFIRANRMYRGQ